MSPSHLPVRWRQWGIAVSIALGSLLAVPVMAQLESTSILNSVDLIPSLNLSFDRTTCLNICEENGRICPSTDRTCGDSYVTCRTQCYSGVSSSPLPTSNLTTQPTQPTAVVPTTQTTSLSSGSTDLANRIAALEALLIKYISLCQAGSCCAVAQQPTQTSQQYYVSAPTSPTVTPIQDPAQTVTQPTQTVYGGPSTTGVASPQSCADCAKLPAGTTKTQCEQTFKCTTTSGSFTLIPPEPALPTPAPTAPTAPSTIPTVTSPTPSVPGVGTAPGGISLTPQPNYFTPYSSWSTSCKATCDNNPNYKTQVQRDQCKVDNCSVEQYKSACSAYCKANNTASTLVSQCMARC